MKSTSLHGRIFLLAAIAFLVFPVPAFAFVEGILWNLVVGVLGTMVALAGQLLDFAVNRFVVGFGTEFARNGVGVAVDATWVVIRDFMNMTFIFGLVYIGMKMILDSDSSNTRRWLVNLIIAALLINFSLFFTKFVIDVSNEFATAIVSEGFQNSNGDVDISIALLDKLGVSTVFQNANTDPTVQRPSGYGYIFGTALILIIAGFVFAAGAIMLIIRFVALNLFMVFSPVMFLSWILPISKLQSVSSSYWSKFLGRAFFAPLYLLFIYISFTILDAMAQTNAIQRGNLAAGLTRSNTDIINSGNDNTFAFFIFASAMLIISLVVSNKLGADGANTAVSMGRDLSKKAQRGATKMAGGATFGTSARLAQGTVGLGASKLAQNQKLQAWAAKSKSGELALRSVRGVADSSFDVRRVGGLGKATGLGEGVKGGYETREKNRVKRDEEFMKSLKVSVSPEEEAEIKKKITDEIKTEEDLIRSVLENEAKSDDELTTEIDELGTEIEQLTTVLERQVQEGTITTQEREQAEQLIKAKTAKRNSSINAYSERMENQVLEDKIQQAGLNASLATDPAEKARYREEMQQLQSQLNEKTAYLTRQENVKNRRENINKDVSKEKSKIQYANQVEYLKRRSKEAAKGITRNPDGTITYNGYSEPFASASVENLKKKFGGNLDEMSKKDKENAAKSDLAKQLEALRKENGGKDKDDDKEEKS